MQSLLRAIPSAIVIAIATFACFSFHVNFPVVSFIFLIIVVLHPLAGDFVSAVIVSVIAFLCLNYFFVAPLFSLAVSDPSDAFALVSFLITGLVVIRLRMRAKQRTAGIFVSYIGLVSYYNFDDWAYQPSYVSSNTPWFFNGIRIQCFQLTS